LCGVEFTGTSVSMELTDVQWDLLKPLVEPKTPANGGVVRGATLGKWWKACYGFCAPEPNGRNCPKTSFRRTRPAIAASSAGCGRARWSRSCGRWPRICWRAAIGFVGNFHRRLLQQCEKGAVQWVQHAAAKGPRSWQLRTAVVFLSPWGLQALRLMKPSSSSRPSSSVSRRRSPDV